MIKPTSYSEGFLNEFLRDVVYKIARKLQHFLDKTNIKCIQQSICLQSSSRKVIFLKEKYVSPFSHFHNPSTSDYF